MHIFLTLPDEEHEDVPLFSTGLGGLVLVDKHSLQKPRAALENYNNGINFLSVEVFPNVWQAWMMYLII